MTLKEQIMKLQTYKMHEGEDTVYVEREDVLKALEQEPCENIISREQAIDAVADLFEMSEYPHPYPQGKPIRLRDIKEKLKLLPSIQPKPKTGHWIFDEMLDRNYYCSECKSMGVDYWDYCPYCGCRMVEPQESEETDERG